MTARAFSEMSSSQQARQSLGSLALLSRYTPIAGLTVGVQDAQCGRCGDPQVIVLARSSSDPPVYHQATNAPGKSSVRLAA